MGKLLSEQEASGLSVAAFARERGVPAWALYDWRRRQRARAKRESKAAFVQVTVKPERAEPPTIELETAGIRVHVPVGFDADELRRLLGVLESC